MMNATTLERLRKAGFSICEDIDQTTLTVAFHSPLSPGHTVKVEDQKGVVWYGAVDDDGVALLTRSDLL